MGCTNTKALKRSKSNIKIALSPKSFIKLKPRLINENYKIEHKIGSGAFGVVMLAIHIQSNQRRAIKSINKQKLPQDFKSSAKFFSEIEILMNSDHPNIVKLLEFYEDDNYWHLVTEYINGGELFDFLYRNKQLTEPVACQYLAQILSAVSYCHSKKVVHRDLKPQNLLLTGDHNMIKIIDFGTSAIMIDGFLQKKYGTSYYIAPEVLRGFYNEKCDMWSIGVILYLLLSGKPPFEGKNEAEVLKKVEKGAFTLTSPVWGKISFEAKDLITKMLTYNQSMRISAKDALKHQWFQKFLIDDSNTTFPDIALNELSAFHISQKLQNAVLTFIATQLSQLKDFQDISKAFKKLDKNNDGKISKEELLEIYTTKGFPVLGSNIEQIMSEADSNNSGFIDYTEFLIACRNKELAGSIEDLEITFKCFDIDRNGRITADELREVLGNGVEKYSVWKELIDEVDMNGDGELDLEEFKVMMLAMISK